MAVEADLCEIVGLKRDKAEVTGLFEGEFLIGNILRYINFISVKGKKVLVSEVSV